MTSLPFPTTSNHTSGCTTTSTEHQHPLENQPSHMADLSNISSSLLLPKAAKSVPNRAVRPIISKSQNVTATNKPMRFIQVSGNMTAKKKAIQKDINISSFNSCPSSSINFEVPFDNNNNKLNITADSQLCHNDSRTSTRIAVPFSNPSTHHHEHISYSQHDLLKNKVMSTHPPLTKTHHASSSHAKLPYPTTSRRGSYSSSTSTPSNACMESTSANNFSSHASSNDSFNGMKTARVCTSPNSSTLQHHAHQGSNHACNYQIRFVMEENFTNSTPPKKRNILTKDQIIRVLHLSQTQACKILGCSISTLKRRFGELKHELGMEKWPSYFDDVRHLPIFPQLYPMSLSFILNEDNMSP
ncbi:hypothetical protein FDP41_006135 [Naegleria fowleri]|uniref:Uncharacterized protein n=1 Tax=Naegleria fowleri TaxID=5763 RepID=A0A6A5BJX1_NAEFO|nr:uncharacterized protein FDP41_006135 [Naegleria fowleri]KAF0974661.1 hypothetical protein FDP41_006135 [Naegleria fowleri]